VGFQRPFHLPFGVALGDVTALVALSFGAG